MSRTLFLSRRLVAKSKSAESCPWPFGKEAALSSASTWLHWRRAGRLVLPSAPCTQSAVCNIDGKGWEQGCKGKWRGRGGKSEPQRSWLLHPVWDWVMGTVWKQILTLRGRWWILAMITNSLPIITLRISARLFTCTSPVALLDGIHTFGLFRASSSCWLQL